MYNANIIFLLAVIVNLLNMSKRFSYKLLINNNINLNIININ